MLKKCNFLTKKSMISRKVIITTSARLHFNSLKMNQSGGRGCGGIGLTLNKPVLKLEFTHNKKISVLGGDDYIKNKVINFARGIIKKLKVSSGVKIEIKKSFPSHIGLGSGTQLGLGVGKGVSLLFKKNIPLNEIAFVNKRAGISGIGFYSFMFGGLIVDGGYRMGPFEDKKTFGDHASHPPPLIGKYKFPKNWKIILITPSLSTSKCELNESEIFIKNTPVLLSDVEAICTNTLMGLIPSLLEEKYFEFIDNLFDVVRLGTKKIELELNRKYLFEVTNLLSNLLVFKWKRLGRYKYILVSDQQKISHKKMDDCLDPTKRYKVKKDFILSNRKFFKNRLPFIGVSSLGPAMYSILLDGFHDVDYLLRETQQKLGRGWNVEIVSARNNSCFCKVVK